MAPELNQIQMFDFGFVIHNRLLYFLKNLLEFNTNWPHQVIGESFKHQKIIKVLQKGDG